MKNKVWINSGHFNTDSGVVVGQYKENDICKKIRDECARLLPEAMCVPDELNLADSIAWVKKNGWEMGNICVDIHLNAHNNNQIRGTEVYHYNNETVAKVFSRYVSANLDIQNRGAIPDSSAAVGSLGWCRQLGGVVVEVCYLTNFFDRAKITETSWQKRAAEGIVAAVRQLQNVKLDVPVLETQITLLTRIIELLKKALELKGLLTKALGGIFKKW